MFLSNAKLGTKLICGFSSVLIFLTLVAFIGIKGMNSNHSDLKIIVTDEAVKVSLSNDMINQTNLIARAVRNIALTADQKMIQKEKGRVEEARTQFRASYDKLAKMVKSDRGRNLMVRIMDYEQKVDPPYRRGRGTWHLPEKRRGRRLSYESHKGSTKKSLRGHR